VPSIRMAFALAGLLSLTALPAVGAETLSGPSSDDPEATAPFPRCRYVEPIRADAERYRDTPVYVSNEQPQKKLRKWAEAKPGFAGMWIDREHLGWVTLMFTEHVDKRQRQLGRRFPGVGVVAVEAAYTEKELRQLQARVSDEFRGVYADEPHELNGVIDDFGVGQTVSDNLVHLNVRVLTEEALSEITARFAGEPLCVDGQDPADLPVPGPQPTAGDDWTLLGSHHADSRQGMGPVYETGIATDAASYRMLWERAGIPGEPTEVDLEDQVAIWFAIAHGSSCPNLRLDDVIVDRDRAVVHPLVVMPDSPMICTADIAGAYQFIVAVDRDRLPAGPFLISLESDARRRVDRDPMVVDIDLSQRGVMAGLGDVHRDRGGGRSPLRSGDYTETTGKDKYVLDVRCGIGYLGELNGIDWVTDEVDIPASWKAKVKPRGALPLIVRMRTKPEPHVKARAAGHTVVYRPTAEAPLACEG